MNLVLVLIGQIPIRLYYSRVHQSYALFYHPVVGVFRTKKLIFRTDQYEFLRQKLDSIDTSERSIKIRLNLRQGLFRMKPTFYLAEKFFRSRRDVRQIRTKQIDVDDEQNQIKNEPTEQESDIWQTVMENKDQVNDKQRKNFK